MSIFNDSRRYSDDPDVYEEWKSEVAWECRRDEYENYDDELVVDLDEEGEADDII